MAKPKKKSNRPHTRVFLGSTELEAMLYLTQYTNMKELSPAGILRKCLLLTAAGVQDQHKAHLEKEKADADNATDNADSE
jgi:hypothetical protein